MSAGGLRLWGDRTFQGSALFEESGDRVHAVRERDRRVVRQEVEMVGGPGLRVALQQYEALVEGVVRSFDALHE